MTPNTENDALRMGGIAGDVARFNASVPVGSRVLFWPGDRSGEVRESATRSRAWLLGDHTPVVMVEGHPGAIALTHVAPVPSRPRDPRTHGGNHAPLLEGACLAPGFCDECDRARAHTEVGWAYGVIYDDLNACGCGYADERLHLVRRVLLDCPLHQGTWRNYDSPLGEWLLCLMDGAGLLEHGGSIGGSWLTDKGKRLLAVFGDEQAWTALLGDNVGYCECCACGYVLPPA